MFAVLKKLKKEEEVKTMLAVLKKLKNKETGVALVLVAFVLLVLLGMSALVVDVGALVLEKHRLAVACDAAALAAAQELHAPNSAVRQKAEEYLQDNQVLPSEAEISIQRCPCPNGSKVTVEATRTVDFAFAPVLGFDQGTVKAHAAARARFGSVTSISGIAPFGIPEQPLVFGQEYQLKSSSHANYGPGNFGALALGGPGANRYRNNIKYGYNGVISVGDWVTTQPGNMSGPTRQGVTYRINQCPHTPECTIDHYHPNCPKIIIVPIIDPTSMQGRSKVQVVGFGAFLLKGVDGNGINSIVRGYFLETTVPTGLTYTTSPNQTSYGLYVRSAKLVE